jgi:hypothetical protein
VVLFVIFMLLAIGLNYAFHGHQETITAAAQAPEPVKPAASGPAGLDVRAPGTGIPGTAAPAIELPAATGPGAAAPGISPMAAPTMATPSVPAASQPAGGPTSAPAPAR